jgi:hypothetical protein
MISALLSVVLLAVGGYNALARHSQATASSAATPTQTVEPSSTPAPQPEPGRRLSVSVLGQAGPEARRYTVLVSLARNNRVIWTQEVRQTRSSRRASTRDRDLSPSPFAETGVARYRG